MVPQVCVLPTSATSYPTRPPTGAARGVLTPGEIDLGFSRFKSRFLLILI